MQASDIGVQWPCWRCVSGDDKAMGPDRVNATLAAPKAAPTSDYTDLDIITFVMLSSKKRGFR